MGQKIDLMTQVQGILPQANGGTGLSSTPSFSDAEIPSGAVNGVNGTFTLANIPNPSASLLLFLNRGLQLQGIDYTLVGATISIAPPVTGSTLYAWYRYQSAIIAETFIDGLSFSDAFAFDTAVPQIPLGLLDSLTMLDQITSMVLGPQQYFDSMVMNDNARVVLLPMNEMLVDQLTMSDAMTQLIGIVIQPTDQMVQIETIWRMFAGTSPSDLFVVTEVMAQFDAIALAMSGFKSFTETLSLSDAFVVQLR